MREHSAWPWIRRPLARLVLLVSFVGPLLVAVPPAFACSCAGVGTASPESMRLVIEATDGGVFVGTVTGTGQVDGRSVVTVQVERVVKGEFGPIVNIDTTDPFREICGGWNPAVGSRLGLFVEGSPSRGWRADACSLRVDPDRLLAWAPSTHPPDPGIEPIGPLAPGGGSIVPWVSLGAATGGLIAGSLLLRRARRRVGP